MNVMMPSHQAMKKVMIFFLVGGDCRLIKGFMDSDGDVMR